MTYNYNYNYDNYYQPPTASYNQQATYSRYNPGFDERANDRASQIFWDAVSMTSSDRNSVAMSQYHSVQELNHDDARVSLIRIFLGEK
jgi:hypothetical protein